MTSTYRSTQNITQAFSAQRPYATPYKKRTRFINTVAADDGTDDGILSAHKHRHYVCLLLQLRHDFPCIPQHRMRFSADVVLNLVLWQDNHGQEYLSGAYDLGVHPSGRP